MRIILCSRIILSAKTESQIRKLENKDRVTEIAENDRRSETSAVNIENAKS